MDILKTKVMWKESGTPRSASKLTLTKMGGPHKSTNRFQVGQESASVETQNIEKLNDAKPREDYHTKKKAYIIH